ncbi:MAG: hypothetical protein HYY04_14185 [Chloroflexi bacterium]|nr:hypothetical protein [Chloroflexota bacterium]
MQVLLDRLHASERGRRLMKRFAWMGPFSPFTTLGTFSPAARHLLGQAEADAERLLHLVRLIVAILSSYVLLFVFGLVSVLPPLIIAAGALVPLALWALIWRHLGRHLPSLKLKCALVLVDALIPACTIALLQSVDGVGGPAAPASGLLTPADVRAIIPPVLVFLALTGAFRLDPRPAMLSTVAALAVYAYLQASFPAPTTPTVVIGALIVGVGLVGVHAARVLRYVALKASEQRVLERFVPEGLTRELARSGDPERAGRLEEVAVLMADIRGFTRLSEALTPVETVRFLNDYFAMVVAPLAREGAVLDKYVGDGLLAFFEGPDQATRAWRAGRGMLEAVRGFRANEPAREPLRIGIAIHSGVALVGTIGAPSRREYTIIGDVVNVTARLEEYNKHFASDLVISGDALRHVRDDTVSGLHGPANVEVRGRTAGIQVHYLVAPLR